MKLAKIELNGEILEGNISINARQKFIRQNGANLLRLKNIVRY